MLYPVETAAAGSESLLMENIIHHHHHHLRQLHHDGESSSSSSSSSSCSSSPRDSSLSSSNINHHHQQQQQQLLKKIKKKKKKNHHRFFRNKPLHKILGGGKSADIILWRDKRMSACMLAGVTVLWFLFECQAYHLVSFSCHFLILSMLILFLCSNLSSFLNRSPPKFQEAIILSEDLFVSFALSLRYELYQAFAIFREVVTGKDLKKFLRAVVVLWVLSVVGSWLNFLTLLYIAFVILQTVAVLYEKHEGQVDTWAEKVMVEINKHYTLLEEKVRQKLAKTKQQ